MTAAGAATHDVPPLIDAGRVEEQGDAAPYRATAPAGESAARREVECHFDLAADCIFRANDLRAALRALVDASLLPGFSPDIHGRRYEMALREISELSLDLADTDDRIDPANLEAARCAPWHGAPTPASL